MTSWKAPRGSWQLETSHYSGPVRPIVTSFLEAIGPGTAQGATDWSLPMARFR